MLSTRFEFNSSNKRDIEITTFYNHYRIEKKEIDFALQCFYLGFCVHITLMMDLYMLRCFMFLFHHTYFSYCFTYCICLNIFFNVSNSQQVL